MDIRKAHTSEHIFMRALTSINSSVRVRKVEHGDLVNEIFVEAMDLSWDEVVDAARIANMVILDDRPIRIEVFDSVGEAVRRYPDLRAYEERIEPPVRVVIVEGFDYAACRMPHLSRTGDAYMFLPVSLNKAKRGRYIIRYLVGFAALDYALQVSRLADEVSNRLSCNIDDVLRAIDNLVDRNVDANRRLRKITKRIFNSSPEYSFHGYRVKYIEAPGMDMDEVGRLADEWIREYFGIILAVSDVGDGYRFLLACNERLNLDMRTVARGLFNKLGGRGGGRANWVMGKLDSIESIQSILYDLLSSIDRG